MKLFRQSAAGEIRSSAFYDELPKYWSQEQGDRLQGAGCCWSSETEQEARAAKYQRKCDYGPTSRIP